MSRALDTIVMPITLPPFKGSTAITAAMGTSDQAALNTNGALIVNEVTFTDLVTASLAATIAVQPDVPRNVVVAIHNDSGGALNAYEGTMKVVVVGKFRGNDVTETISVVSTSGNKAIANLKYRAWAGSQPFESITSITVINPVALADRALKFAVGVGCKMGLPFDPASNLAADVLKVCVDSADLAVSYNTTYKTVSVGTTADGKTAMFWVKTRLLNQGIGKFVKGY